MAEPPSSATSIAWPLQALYVGAFLYMVSPHRDRFPAALATIFCFGTIPILLPRVRPATETPVCPLNGVLAAFFVQLVVLPLLICFSGPVQGALPFLPSVRSINVALLLSCLAFAGFSIGYHVAADRPSRPNRVPRDQAWNIPEPQAAILYLALGLIGITLAFHSPGGVLTYLQKTGSPGVPTPSQNLAPPDNSLGFVASLFLRPFLGFAIVLLWCRWLDRGGHDHRVKATIGSLLAAAVVLFAYSTFSYNRGAFVAPLVAILAVYSGRVRRLSLILLLALGIGAVVLLTAYRYYRASTVSLTQAVGSQSQVILAHTDVNSELQIYGGAPQFTGFLLEQTHYARTLHYGTTLVSSLLSPVPRLGRSFRESSGTTLYNGFIYGDLGTADQVVPFQGELFINFSFPAVAVGYFLLGFLVQALQRRFLGATDGIKLFVWQYAATWVAYLVAGGAAVVSQIFVYFFWPAYVLAGWSWLRSLPGRSPPRRGEGNHGLGSRLGSTTASR